MPFFYSPLRYVPLGTPLPFLCGGRLVFWEGNRGIRVEGVQTAEFRLRKHLPSLRDLE